MTFDQFESKLNNTDQRQIRNKRIKDWPNIKDKHKTIKNFT